MTKISKNSSYLSHFSTLKFKHIFVSKKNKVFLKSINVKSSLKQGKLSNLKLNRYWSVL